MLWFSLLFSFALADAFTCETDGTQIKGNVIRACGVGQHHNLSEAQLAAYYHAHHEAMMFYLNNSGFYPNNKTEIPARQECRFSKNKWTCFRLLIVTVDVQKVANN
jgi:hypothetical protein